MVTKNITGNEMVNLQLTVDQVSFIVSGLRDCAQRIGKEMEDLDSEIFQDYTIMQQRNVMLADTLEQAYLNQI